MYYKNLLLIILLSLAINAQAQLYVPEIKVQATQGSNIGLGVTNPYAALTVGYSNINRLGFSPAQTDSDYNVIQGYTSGLRLFAGAHNIHYEAGNQSTHYHKFKVGGIDNLLYIGGNGRIGINTASPGATLHIGGETFIRDLRIVENVDVTKETSWIYSKYGSNRQLGLLLTNDGYTKAEIKLYEGNAHNPYISFSTSPSSGSNAYERMRITRDGWVGILDSSPSDALDVNGYIRMNGARITSDQKVKQNITTYSAGLAIVKHLKPVKYELKKEAEVIQNESRIETDSVSSVSLNIKKKEVPKYVGIIAQELQQIAPDLVQTDVDEDGGETLSYDFSALTFVLINAIKEQQAIIEQLQQEVENLKKNK